ncbi:MAG: DUF305 domain-containing protein [Anaerolineae bacterium]|nr:DUF305 domain-containing protein [Anaerolineae bacterium]
MKRFWIAIVFGVVAFTVLLVPAVFADGPSEGREGRAELRYMQGMIDHHQMALDMATDCLTKAATESVRTLCQNVIDEQSAEISTMQTWLQDWYGVTYTPMSMTEMMDMMGMGDMMGSMMGSDPMPGGMMEMPEMGHGMMVDPPMMMGMMAGLSQLFGTQYEIAWLESMIDHHDDAINMSERLLARLGDAGHPELRELAQNIIDAQTAETATMEQMIAELSS